jgi:hypothetical protein
MLAGVAAGVKVGTWLGGIGAGAGVGWRSDRSLMRDLWVGAVSFDPVVRTAQWSRWLAPQIGQIAIPRSVSTSRKVGQPLVRQNGRIVALAADARRRIRRMELERPATDVVVVRDIMEGFLVVLSGAPQAVWALGSDPDIGFARSGQPVWGPERRLWSGSDAGSVHFEALDQVRSGTADL